LPFYFGEPDRQLFGFFHSPANPANEVPAILICSPLGTEFEQSYHFVHHLANQLARAGHAVLRFNYFGTGNSAGDTAAVTFPGLVGDTAKAAQELYGKSGTRAVAIIGVRSGATIAALFSAQCEAGTLRKLVLWDAFADGNNNRNWFPRPPKWTRGFSFSKGFITDMLDTTASTGARIGRGEKTLLVQTHAATPTSVILQRLDGSDGTVESKQYAEVIFSSPSQTVPYQVVNDIAKWVKSA